MKRQLRFNIKNIYSIAKKRQANKFDCIMAICGDRGMGKSTLALKICLRDKKFKMADDIAYSRDDIIQQLSTKKKGIILADEMIMGSYNRDFYSGEQKKLIKIVNLYRDSGNILICCVPKFTDLDKQFMQFVVLRIDIHKRGLGFLHLPKRKIYDRDVWDIINNQKVEVKSKLYLPTKFSTFKGLISFRDVTEKQRALYESIKQQKRNIVFEAEETGGKEITEKIPLNKCKDCKTKAYWMRSKLKWICKSCPLEWDDPEHSLGVRKPEESSPSKKQDENIPILIPN